MRIIKFRAWDGERIVDFGALRCKQGHRNAFENTISKGTTDYAWDKKAYTLMQYTGLKDKNGKEIYEGDIVRNEQHFDEPRQVAWSEANASWYLYPLGEVRQNEVDVDVFNTPSSLGMKWFTQGWFDESYEDRYAVEVIGNIWENPELLEKSDAQNS